MSRSGGQRQSVAIARSLLLDPPIILLDEPTSHMDNSPEAASKKSIRETQQGKTPFLVTHRRPLLSLNDLPLIIHNGKKNGRTHGRGNVCTAVESCWVSVDVKQESENK